MGNQQQRVYGKANILNPYTPKNPFATGFQRNRSEEEIQWDIDNVGSDPLAFTRIPTLNMELSEANLKTKDVGILKDLTDAGYPFGSRVPSSKDWGGYGNLGGPKKANDIYQQNLSYGKETGDWSYMTKFMDAAQYGSRKYHRSGLFGTGIRISPKNLFLAGATAFAGAGGLGAIAKTGATAFSAAQGVGNVIKGLTPPAPAAAKPAAKPRPRSAAEPPASVLVPQPVPEDKIVEVSERRRARKLYAGRGRRGSILSGSTTNQVYG